jgi:hypothetical protein
MPQVTATGPIIRWITANSLNYVAFTLPTIQWQTKKQTSITFPIQWHVGKLTFPLSTIKWSIDALNPQPYGVWYPTFIARHTGEPNSPQVIRIRSSYDSTKIIYESPAETSLTGFIALDAKYDDYVVPKGVLVTPTRESDFSPSFVGNSLVQGVGSTLLSFNDLPGYVTQEYQSTTRRDYIIRYLGYLTPNPSNSVLSRPMKAYDANKAAQLYGYTVVGRNLTGFAVVITVTYGNGQTYNGILPANQALVIIKKSGTQNQIGYVPVNIIQGDYNPDLLQDQDLILSYFTPLSSTQ